jgi:hypothetical protein
MHSIYNKALAPMMSGKLQSAATKGRMTVYRFHRTLQLVLGLLAGLGDWADGQAAEAGPAAPAPALGAVWETKANPAAGKPSAAAPGSTPLSAEFWESHKQICAEPLPPYSKSVPVSAMRLELGDWLPAGTQILVNEKILQATHLPPSGSELFWLQPGRAQAAKATPASNRPAPAPQKATPSLRMDAFYFLTKLSAPVVPEQLCRVVYTWLSRAIGWQPTTEGGGAGASGDAIAVELLAAERAGSGAGLSGLTSVRLSRGKSSRTVWLRVLFDLPIVYVLAGYPGEQPTEKDSLRKVMLAAKLAPETPSPGPAESAAAASPPPNRPAVPPRPRTLSQR